jgi:hypothetical protein
MDNENVCKDLRRKLEAREYLDILHAMCRGNLDPSQCVQQAANSKQQRGSTTIIKPFINKTNKKAAQRKEYHTRI